MNDPETAETEKKPAFGRKKGPLLWLALFLLVAGGVALLVFFPPVQGIAFLKKMTAPEAGTEVFSSRIAALEETLAALSQAPESSTAKLNAIEANIASLDSRLAVLEKRASEIGEGDGAAFAPEIERLQSELGTVSKRLADLTDAPKRPDPESPHLRAIEALREGIMEYGPFRDRLTALLAVAGGDPAVVAAVAPLSAYADQGIPTLPMLRADFDGMAAAVLETRWQKADVGWQERLLANLAGFLTIRRTGDVAGNSLEAVLARAEQALRSGDLARAVALLEKIEAPAAKAAAPWLRDAQARLAAQAAIRQLRRQAFSVGETPSDSPR